MFIPGVQSFYSSDGKYRAYSKIICHLTEIKTIEQLPTQKNL